MRLANHKYPLLSIRNLLLQHYTKSAMNNSTLPTSLVILIFSLYLFPARFHAQDGSLDLSFDSDGFVTTPIGSSEDYGRAVAIQSDGKIVVAGYSYNGDRDEFAVVRYNANGDLDDSFDSDGIVTTPIGNSSNRAHALAIQNDGKIVVTGYYYNGTDNDFAVARYNTDGSLDNTFDDDGYASKGFGQFSNDRAFAVAIQSDGKIVLAGYNTNPMGNVNREFALVRFNSNGSADNSFDGDGLVSTAIEAAGDEARSIIIQSDGKIVVAGFSFDSTIRKFVIVRYNSNGIPDNTFDADGIVATSISDFDDAAYSMAIQNDGKYILAGYTSGLNNGGTYDFATVRYNIDGSLDNTFADDGMAVTSIGTSTTSADTPNAIAIQSDGKILVAGFGQDEDNNFALVRYNTDGSLDNTFDTDGIVRTQKGASGSDDTIYSLAIQSDGKIVAAGYSSDGDEYVFAVARYHNMGTSEIKLSEFHESEIGIYPNPTNGIFSLKNISANTDVEVYNSLGDLILKERSDPNKTMSLPQSCASGIYTIRLISQTELTKVTFVIVKE